MRTRILAGNWKMNHGPKAAREFFESLSREDLKGLKEAVGSGKLEALLFPPFLSLSTAVPAALPVRLGAQNVHWKDSGAFTGEVAAPMLLESGIKDALVAHSERRQHFGETDVTARDRTRAALQAGLKVILCIGETRAEREAGKTREVLLRQLLGALPSGAEGPAAFLDGRLRLAYEPVWAIGTGLTATPAQAQEAHALIRQDLRDRFGKAAADKTPLLYGGSVTPSNLAELLACPDVDGGLVGGASLKPVDYAALLRICLSSV